MPMGSADITCTGSAHHLVRPRLPSLGWSSLRPRALLGSIDAWSDSASVMPYWWPACCRQVASVTCKQLGQHHCVRTYSTGRFRPRNISPFSREFIIKGAMELMAKTCDADTC
jgi:hypothetical protein